MLGKRVKSARVRRGLTQEGLAETVGVSQNYLSAIERGDKIPRLATFIKIANGLQVSADYLLEEELCAANQINLPEFVVTDLDECQRRKVYDILTILLRDEEK